MNLKTVDEGVVEYGEMLQRQRLLFSEMVERKKSGQAVECEYLLLVEHPPVITLGKHASTCNLLMPEQVLREKGIDVFRIERGGDITYHGPGQLVVYPLLDLEQHRLGIKDYVHLLEEAVILTLKEYGIRGQRVAGASGVWLDAGQPSERKICALGVKCSRFVTMHGLALNVNTDLSGFEMINPCGFTDKGVTSMRRECGHEFDMNGVKSAITAHFQKLLI